ncbi:hypothetical protein PanWU01x14_034720 [Parasponia andersonii]|uniref:Uncharacterized protein n=1 Tax=Parasponia andersonii TaxID=3476 RepID=A0A2P5DT15_PARAD|nr:hypothetical protein PanWU01x14_034720 [Parasponia andersonii]
MRQIIDSREEIIQSSPDQRGLAVMSYESLTQLRHYLLFLVGEHTFRVLLVSSTHCHFHLEGPCLALLFSLHPQSGWGRDFPWLLLTPELLLDLILPSRRQAFDPAFVPDWVTLPGGFLRHQAACFLLSFSRVSSDVIWLFVRGERSRETLTLSLALFSSHRRRQTVSAVLTNCPRVFELLVLVLPTVHVSKLLVLFLPTVHVSSLSEDAFDLTPDRRGWGSHLQRLSDA